MEPVRARLVTKEQLVATLLPYIVGYPWALDTIEDLWRMGAPVPSWRPGQGPEVRVLLAGAFRRWWEDVRRRQGLSLAADEVLSKMPGQSYG